ncbi:MAG: RIP metalloprotease RseP [Steroidobacteraceae bacterium]|nr:RIP metalloprotease RseP [Steroidobacteraceae bacterium]
MQIGWNILWFLIGISLLVTVHEYGHFWVARKLGFKVLRFSIGFGKPLWKHVGKGPDHTEFVIAALPLGGYVKLVDERDGPVDSADVPRAYQSKHPWRRILMLFAGPGANFVFAILLLWGIFAFSGTLQVKAQIEEVVAGSPAAVAGLRAGDELRAINGSAVSDQADANIGLLDAISDQARIELGVRGSDGQDRILALVVDDATERRRLTEPNQLYDGLGFHFWAPSVPPVLGVVMPGGPAEAAGFKVGDVVMSVDSSPVRTFREFSDYVNARPDKNISVTVKRGAEELTRSVRTVSAKDDSGRAIGRVMVDRVADITRFVPPGMMTRVPLKPMAALGASLSESWKMTAVQAKLFGRMLTGKFSFKNLSSPIGIAKFAGDSARVGPEFFLRFLVLISLSLGFLNLLPIPILDGGQIVFALTEWVKGSPLSERAQAFGWHAGLIMLVLMMGVAVFNDLSARFG